MPYLDLCIKETLRMHPPVQMTQRINTQSLELKGYKIPAGATVINDATYVVLKIMFSNWKFSSSGSSAPNLHSISVPRKPVRYAQLPWILDRPWSLPTWALQWKEHPLHLLSLPIGTSAVHRQEFRYFGAKMHHWGVAEENYDHKGPSCTGRDSDKTGDPDLQLQQQVSRVREIRFERRF